MTEENGIVINSAEVDNIISEYAKQKVASAGITVKLSGTNNLDVLFLLHVMGKKEPDINELAEASEALLDGKSIEFWNKDKLLYSCVYNRGSGNKLHMLFSDKVYLYDILQQTVYALLLKKLTPRLESST